MQERTKHRKIILLVSADYPLRDKSGWWIDIPPELEHP